MKKKILSILLVLCMVCMLLPASVLADGTTGSGPCGEGLTWTLDEDGKLTISGSGAMDDFQSMPPWSGLREYVKSVTIESGVTSIGDHAFSNCLNLESITIPESVTSIGDFAFETCEGLTEMTVGSGVTAIGEQAFRFCTNLESVTIPESVQSIGNEAFWFCEKLTAVTGGSGLESIGSGAFDATPWLENAGDYPVLNGILLTYQGADTEVMIPAGVKIICNSAFAFSDVTGVTIPEGVTVIGDSAFRECGKLKTVNIPDSVTVIGGSAFFECNALEEIKLGNSVTSIGDRAFFGCDALSGVSVQDSLKSIGACAFQGCLLLKNAPIGSKVTDIGDHAFCECWSLKNVTVPDSVQDLGDYAFTNCINLESVTLGSGVKSIGKGLFYCDYKLAEVYIPSGVSVIKDYAFEMCNDLKNVHFAGTAEQWGDIDVEIGNDSLTTAEITFGSHVHSYVNGLCSCGMADPDVDNPFIDVIPGEYYFDPVLWAAETGITMGTEYNLFSPEETVTRAQVVTFLWRAAGKPAPESAENRFTDVSPEEYYYDAVLWAVENGITVGTEDTLFSPDELCTRAQIVTFLARFAGVSDTTTDSVFEDVAADDYFAAAVKWAVDNGITFGTDETHFSPDENCTRAQAVTFLFRWMTK